MPPARACRAPRGGRAADSEPSSSPASSPATSQASEPSFRLRITQPYPPETKDKVIFEQTYDAPADYKGKPLIPKTALGQAVFITYLIKIDWPDIKPPRRERFWTYEVSFNGVMENGKRKKIGNSYYFGKGRVQILVMTNTKEGDAMMKEAIDQTVKDVRARMALWKTTDKK